MKKRETLFIIDGSSVIYRAFHAVPSTFTNAKGMPTNAVYGFTQTLRKILHDFKPEYIGIAFDVKGPSFRHELFDGYKAERPPMPDTLSVQMPFIKQMVKAFNIPAIEVPAYEADDVIATLVKRAESRVKVALITGDKDMYQLVDENTVILDYLSGKEYGPAEVEEKFGVRPKCIRELLALMGDASDNIPGVPGVGVKTAAKLLNEYCSLEGIYENISNISKEKIRENLKTFKDQAFLSRELATLHPDVPFDYPLEKLRYTGPDYDLLEPLLIDLDFRKILQEILPEVPRSPEEGTDYRLIDDTDGLKGAVSRIKALKSATFTVFTTEEGVSGKITGAAIGLGEKTAFYIPVQGQAEAGIPENDFLSVIKPVMEDGRIIKDTDNSKALYVYFGKSGIDVKGIGMDTSLASYLLDPSKSEHTVERLAYEMLGSRMEEAGERVEDLKIFACQKACNIERLSKLLDKQLEIENLKDLYVTMELPLSSVLAKMELKGIRIDPVKLKDLSKEIELELASIEERIYAAAGMKFNISSPKQLSELLFERLKLKPVKKTKTGFSTDEEVLTQLAPQHEIPQHIINFRQLAKLKSTYVDALTELVNPSTGRLHTSFNQTVTATGRLSSSKPNLQNIPIRGEAAGRIREAFVAEKGFRFLAADYSQIELRIVAHMSNDPVLIDSFLKDEDIHTRTASEVFGIMPALVNPEMRRRAKAINFGIIYGMGPYGLSTELKISMKEAIEYINSYFAHYRMVKLFIDKTIEEAKERGYTVTLFGRRRFIPELKSPVDPTQKLGQRLAINTPIQGSAADMIKAAMIKIDTELQKGGYRSRMILQIHDELVFEVAEDEMDVISGLVKTTMEGIVSLKVPIKVNIESGHNWRDVE